MGHGLDEGTTVGPLIDAGAVAKVERLLADAVAKGARVVVGGADAPRPSAAYFPPTVLTEVRPGMELLQEEVFGPVVPIATFADEAEAIAVANDTEFGLAAYVFTGDAARGQRVAAALRFGHVALDSGTGPTPEAPFGGMKHSGYGREGGAEGVLEFVELQTVPRR
ncbi:MAG: aldehyde dehydrogenase family protein [Kofleriaceae bacterium]